MRLLMLFIYTFLCQSISAVDMNKRTYSALEYIKSGYIQYGFEELKKTAAVNDLAAQYYVALCYENGIGVEKDLTQAFWMYRKAAERGLPDAMYHIASFYRNGVVVSKDISRENEWMRRYNQKGGKLTLPDLIQINNEGLKHSENYALNPNDESNSQSNLVTQGSLQKQTINNITIVQQTPDIGNIPQPSIDNNPVKEVRKSDVDTDIPVCPQDQENTFALIFANENYHEVAIVPHALNDGSVFAEYCQKTLGIPQNNVRFVADATLNGIQRHITWITQIMDVYQGEATIIIYYAGHGIPDESNRTSYLLPVDGYGSDVNTGYSLDKLYTELASKPAKAVFVLLDACFSGTNRDGRMLASARGVAIKAKQNTPKGKMIVLSAAQGDETAHSYNEKGHGLFTYYLLKKLQETQGNVSFGELTDYITAEVRRMSVVINGKMQTPIATPSSSAADWKEWKLK